MSIARIVLALGLVLVGGMARAEVSSSQKSELPAVRSAVQKPAPVVAQAPQAPQASQAGTAKAGSTNGYDFGDFSSMVLTTKAWDALNAGDYAAVDVYATKCISLYEARAVEQQAGLTDFAPKEKGHDSWALNDVATSYFILGKARAKQGRTKEAQDAWNTVIQRFGYAQCWDPKGWFWKVAQAAKDNLATLGTGYDFGDYSSMTLTGKAWEALNSGDHKAVQLFAKKCIELYEPKAKEQQAGLTDFAPKEKEHDYWALNDVATCYFILGKSHLEQGNIKEAQAAFNIVIERFPNAQCWDPKGWFWKVAAGASDKLATMGTGYDYGDYTSMTLTTKAWEALGKDDHKGVEIYTKKCIELYEEEAKKQQSTLTEFAPKDKAFDYWALNDVATCYFILGESLLAQKRFQEAKAAFDRVVNDFSFAQCWDPKGWFWKVAVASRGRLNKIMAESAS